ncbi:hypothetical protein Gotur_004330 [Gossypium turneri]
MRGTQRILYPGLDHRCGNPLGELVELNQTGAMEDYLSFKYAYSGKDDVLEHKWELEKSKPVILTGDFNCAHEEIDIYNPAGNRRSAGFTIEERQSFSTNFLSRGFVDTFRKQNPDVVGYTYWGYRHGARKGNKGETSFITFIFFYPPSLKCLFLGTGWRLDYFLVSDAIADDVHDSFILPDVIGSDHCPIGLVLKL